jgi:cytochrome c6
MMRRLFPIPLLVALLACGSSPDASVAVTGDGRPDGAVLFDMYCVLCHGDDGKLGINGAKDLTQSALSRDEMIGIVAYGRNTMAGYGQVLDAAQIEVVVDHVRSLPKAE